MSCVCRCMACHAVFSESSDIAPSVLRNSPLFEHRAHLERANTAEASYKSPTHAEASAARMRAQQSFVCGGKDVWRPELFDCSFYLTVVI